MIPSEIAKAYDLLAEQWHSDPFPRHLEYDQYPELHLYLIAQKT